MWIFVRPIPAPGHFFLREALALRLRRRARAYHENQKNFLRSEFFSSIIHALIVIIIGSSNYSIPSSRKSLRSQHRPKNLEVKDMPRPTRFREPGYTYHVYSRCIETKDLMRSNFFKDKFMSVLNRTMERYTFKLIAYEILDNHFHFIIQTVKNGEDISRIMQYIKARFAEAYNREMKRTGPFWNERFKCKVVEKSKDPRKYLFQLLWYMGYNPVKKKKVKDPRESRYGSINL